MSVDASKFPPLSICGIGDVRGLLGANCRHSIGPGDGVHNPFAQFDSEENRKREKLEKRQRLLERRIRKSRREVMGLQGAMDKAETPDAKAELAEAHRKAAVKLQRQEAEYDAFCKENDMRKLYDRLQVARYGPKQAKAAEQVAEEEYQVWSKELNFNDSVKTLANYYEVKYTNSPRFELLQRYVSSVQSGRLSPLSGFGLYEEYCNRIQNEIVGQTVGSVRITGQSQHFLERVFGCMRDPKTKLPRSGVEFDDLVDCILHPVKCGSTIEGENGNRSFVVIGKRAKVSVNSDTGILIQTNPWRA